jgi:hypothetical protein
VEAADRPPASAADPMMLVTLSHRDRRPRLDEYQWNAADFVLMQIFHFRK